MAGDPHIHARRGRASATIYMCSVSWSAAQQGITNGRLGVTTVGVVDQHEAAALERSVPS